MAAVPPQRPLGPCQPRLTAAAEPSKNPAAPSASNRKVPPLATSKAPLLGTSKGPILSTSKTQPPATPRLPPPAANSWAPLSSSSITMLRACDKMVSDLTSLPFSKTQPLKPRIMWMNGKGRIAKVQQVYQKQRKKQYTIGRPKNGDVNESVMRLLKAASAEMALRDAAADAECTAAVSAIAESSSPLDVDDHEMEEEETAEEDEIGSAYFVGNSPEPEEELEEEENREPGFIPNPSDVPKRPRGRPRKRPLSPPRRARETDYPPFDYSTVGEQKARRGRGRQKKSVGARSEECIPKKASSAGLAECSLVNPHVAKTSLSTHISIGSRDREGGELPLYGPSNEEKEKSATDQKAVEESLLKQKQIDDESDRPASGASIGEERTERRESSPAGISEITTSSNEQLPPGVEISKITGKIKKKYNKKTLTPPTNATSERDIKRSSLDLDPSKEPRLKREKENIPENKKDGEEEELLEQSEKRNRVHHAEKAGITAEKQDVLKKQLRDFRADDSYIPNLNVQAEEHGYTSHPWTSPPFVAEKPGEKIRKKQVRLEPALVESFRCAKCYKKVLDQQFAMKEHAREHACDTLRCPFEGCYFRSQTRKRVSYHTTNEHREWRVAVDLCEKDQRLAAILFRLVQKCFPRSMNLPLEKGLSCKLCEALIAPSYNSLHEHVLTHLPSRPLSCSVCSFDAYNHTQMSTHFERRQCGGRVIYKIDSALRRLIRKIFLTAFPILEGCDFTNDAEVRKAAGIRGDNENGTPQCDMEEDVHFPPANPGLAGNDVIDGGRGSDYPNCLPAPHHVSDSGIRKYRQGLLAFQGFQNDHCYCRKRIHT